MHKLDLCLEAGCLLAPPTPGPDDPRWSREALRFIAWSVRRFHVIVWTPDGGRPAAVSLKRRIGKAMVEELGNQRGYVLFSLVLFTHQRPRSAIMVTSEKLREAKGWPGLATLLENERQVVRPRRRNTFASLGGTMGVLMAGIG